ncbi:hypothetical protein RJ640_007901 [Escallonia rubra]|uniref:Uncoupling protein 3 n=1 Tax=Escallonia rubra TaxID=112253 RepID=A0AA88QQV8_9ASTE|nr:hypothetical protein RJ640_007901 [Escallonia rubra]
MEGRDNAPRPPAKKLAVALASLSAMVAETTTFPIDITKTRLQLIESPSTRRASAFRVASEIVRAEGPLGLYQGLSPALLRHLFYTPVRIVGYEHLRERFVIVVVRYSIAGWNSLDEGSDVLRRVNLILVPRYLLLAIGREASISVTNARDRLRMLSDFPPRLAKSPTKSGCQHVEELSKSSYGSTLRKTDIRRTSYVVYYCLRHVSLIFYHTCLVSQLCGLPLIVQVVASPADLVKVRMQADGRMISQGLQPRYLGPLDALNKILHQDGLGGLWKGVLPNVQRAFLVNMGELACYDNAKRFIIEKQIASDNIYAHTLASIMSGLSATALSCPADVVKTRMMNQAVNEEGQVKYKNSFDCLVKTVRLEGSRALWKGFFPTWARLGPWQFVFWVSYEKFRQIAGLTSF